MIYSNTEPVPVPRRTNAVRFSNNVISEWKDFSKTMEKIIEDPRTAIEWIDLSFNDMSSIDKCLLEYRNLKVLYLHGNSIEKLGEVLMLTIFACSIFEVPAHANIKSGANALLS